MERWWRLVVLKKISYNFNKKFNKYPNQMKIFWSVCGFFLLGVFSARASYDVYVDKDNQTGVEDGTEASPFDTISEGVALAVQNVEAARKIWVAAGEYQEQVELEAGVELFGVGSREAIIVGKDGEGDHFDWTVKMRDNTKIKDLGIKYGKQGILVSSGADVEVEDCRIYESKINGIYVEKARSKKEEFILKDSKIYDSEKRGMYIKKKKVEIEDNEVYDNDEEGIDLRSSVLGSIAKNELYDNGESGLEMELRSVDLKLKNNKIYSNDTNGINFQYRGKNKSGEVKMSSNKIYKNKHFGLRCGTPSGGNPAKDYFSKAITFSKDEIKNNKENNYGKYCNF